jgi:multidrug efflux pump subunit AcrB
VNLPRFASRHGSIVVGFVLIFAGFGLYNFQTMSRRENPAITIRQCLILTRWPGAPTQKVEELVTDPIEKKVAEINDVKEITSQSSVGFSKVVVEMDETIADVDQLWDEVRAKVAEVRLPDGCGAPFVNSDFGDVYDVCLALFQRPPEGGWTPDSERYRYSPRRLEVLAETVEAELKLVPQVSRVDFWGVPEEQICVYVDSADWAQIGLTAGELADIMRARNIVAPGGEVDTDRGSFSVKPTGEFEREEEIDGVVVGRLDGRVPVRLRDLPVTVERGYEDPLKTMVRYVDPQTPGTRALLLGISMKDGRNVVEMGARVAARLRKLEATVLPPDIEIRRVNDLPRQVDKVVQDFAGNLAQAVAIVLVMAFLLVGVRAGLVMATAVPLSMVTAFAVVPLFGVELEQFSIASLIIALGLVVDNATVVTENSMRMLEEGLPRRAAVIKGAHSLALPILAATLTTVAAFLPMLTIAGNMGEYIRSLPIVVASTLIASYLVAMLVAPLMCYLLLDPGKLRRKHLAREARRKESGPGRFDRIVTWCVRHPAIVLGIAAAVFLGSLGLSRVIGDQFFPQGERDQFFLKVWLPESASFRANERICREIEQAVLETSRDADGTERLAHLVSFLGTGGPRLMLTQNVEQDYPYFAHLVVTTTDPRVTLGYVADLKQRLAVIPGARIEVFPFSFGPPLERPVEFRLSGPDADLLRTKAEEMLDIMRRTPGVETPSSDWGASSYQVEVDVDADAANLAGVTNADVAITMSSLLSGARLTTFREGDHLVPVVLRTTVGDRDPLTNLAGIFVNGRAGKVPLASVARVVPTWQPAIVARRDNVRTVTVGCRVREGLLPNTVAARMKPEIEGLLQDLPPGYRLAEGGEREKTAESQAKIGRAILIAVFLIVLVLVVQYNSFLKPLVILLTVPLAIIGVVVGLFLTGWAMGFMAMLGILSLAGIVINDAIVLIDFLEEKVRDGMGVREAAATASRLRMKPIVLTSLTTIGGLLPLSLFGGPLWAPMSNGMIFGLIFSTALTLIVVPTLYVVFVERLGMKVVRAAS